MKAPYHPMKIDTKRFWRYFAVLFIVTILGFTYRSWMRMIPYISNTEVRQQQENAMIAPPKDAVQIGEWTVLKKLARVHVYREFKSDLPVDVLIEHYTKEVSHLGWVFVKSHKYDITNSMEYVYYKDDLSLTIDFKIPKSEYLVIVSNVQ